MSFLPHFQSIASVFIHVGWISISFFLHFSGILLRFTTLQPVDDWNSIKPLARLSPPAIPLCISCGRYQFSYKKEWEQGVLCIFTLINVWTLFLIEISLPLLFAMLQRLLLGEADPSFIILINSQSWVTSNNFHHEQELIRQNKWNTCAGVKGLSGGQLLRSTFPFKRDDKRTKSHSRQGDTVPLTFMRQFLCPWISKQCEWHRESTAECLIESIIPRQTEGHHPRLFRQDGLG